MNQVDSLCMGCMTDKTTPGICPNCGYDEHSAYDQNYLAPGTTLGERYIVGALKSRNGERGQYIGFDTQIGEPVWIREYFPYTIAHRDKDTGEVIPNTGYGAQYKALLSDYVDTCNEVKRMSVSDPVVPIENIVGENGTVYSIFRYMDLLSLEEYLTTRGGRLSYEEAVEFLMPLFHAVDNMHLRGVIHRGISPYTVFVDTAGKLYLDEFALSGTRTGGSELQAELFNGYSAPEQYATKGWQGTWTDVYALAAIFYRTVSGIVPPKSTMISSGRALTALGDLVTGVPEKVSRAIQQAMHINTNERTQTVGVLISAMLSDDDVPETAVFDFVPTIRDSPPPPKRYIPDEYGHTEEVNLEELGSFYFQEETPQRSHRREPEEQRYEDEYYDDTPPRRTTAAGRALIVAIIALTVTAGVILAVVLTDRIKPETPSTSSASEPAPPPESSPSATTSSQSSAEDEAKEIEVPDFTGRDADSVRRSVTYRENYTFVIKEEEDEEIEKGKIISQSPKEGTKVKDDEKTEVTLVVSKGPKMLIMPDVTGLSYEEALEALDRFATGEKVVFEVSRPIEIYDANMPAGIVKRTMPQAGDEFDPKKVLVELHVTSGSNIKESEQSSSESSASQGSSESSSQSSEESSRGDNGADQSPNKPPKR